jgi:hypothetical protein
VVATLLALVRQSLLGKFHVLCRKFPVMAAKIPSSVTKGISLQDIEFTARVGAKIA